MREQGIRDREQGTGYRRQCGKSSANPRRCDSVPLLLSRIDLQKTAGFTLLEIMIALAIIGMTLSVILHTVNRHADVLYQNTVTTEMYQLAKEKMHELEKSAQPSKGKLDNNYIYENSVARSPNSNIVELKTVIRGQGKEVVLKEFVIKEQREG